MLHTLKGKYGEEKRFFNKSVLHLSGRLVAKCIENDGATQILPNTGPTGKQRISIAKVHVRSSQMMQACWTFIYQNINFFFNIFMSDNPKFVWTTQRTDWVVRWVVREFSLAAAL